MATGTVTKGPSPEARRVANERELIEYEKYIDQQLTKTARQVQGMDIATGLMCWLAGALAYLLAAAAVDHWALAGGLGTWGRWLALFGLLAGSGWFLARRVLPPLLNRINPVYSAHTIERGRPQLKNSLVNFLLLRREPRELSEAVRDALQSQAASGLAAAPVEHSIDRSPLVRFALVLLGAVLVSALYIMFSPKDPLRSAARVILPWASIERPTRFTIADIQAEVVETGRKFTGGPAEVFYGQRIKITAAAVNRGRAAEEPIVLRFTTADGSANDQALTLESRERNADIVLPAGTLAAAVGGGMQQSLDYTLTAGDAVAGPFHIKVLAAPSIEIEAIEYEFPAYTKLPKRTLADRGDVNALEGTRVVVRAKANQEIAQAWIDLDCDGRRDATMVTKGQEAGGNFLLALQEDRRTPVNGQYLLRFKNEDGFENPQPIRYRIEVTPDLAPEIAWESPREIDAPREQPIDEPLELMFAASDKDFELASVKLRAEVETEDKAAKKPWETSLLAKPTAEKWTSNATAFIPEKHGYTAGQTVLLWGEASDNRQPKPNVVETPKLRVTLRPPRDPEEKRGPTHQAGDTSEKKPPENGEQKEPPRDDEQQPKNSEKQRGKEGAQPNADQQDPAERGEKKPQEREAGEKGKPEEGNKEGTEEEQQPGQQEKQPGEKGSGAEESQPGGGESSEEGEDGESGQSGGKGKQGKPGEAGDQESAGEGASGEASRDGRQSGKPSEKQSGDPSGEPGEGDESENGNPGEPRAGDRGSKTPPRRVDPDTQDGEAFERMQEHFDKQDQGKNGAKQPSEKQPSEKQSGEGQTGEKQPGAEQPGEKQPGGEKQSGEKQPGQEDTGAQEPGAEGSEEGSESGAGDKQRPDESSTNQGGDPSEQENATGNGAKPEQGAGESGKPEPGAENPQGAEQGKPGDEEMKPEDAQASGEKGEPGENGEQERAGEEQQTKGNSKEPGDEKQPGNNQPSAEKESEGGAGQQSQKESQGTPEAQGQNKERDKSGQQKGTKPEEGENDPQSPSTSEHESDSRGGEAGDQSGGGEEGGGQKAKQNGTGGAGSNTEADDGANASDQSGDGETDGRGGDDQKAPGPTGDKNSQQTKGEGRQGSDGEAGNESQPRGGEQGKQGNRAGGENAQQPPQEQSSGDNKSAKGNEGQGNPNGAQPSGQSPTGNAEPNGGGQGSDEEQSPRAKQPQQELGGDAANQDYANRATDLVLDKLKDQLKKGEPDEALLDKLQWTKQDLERFVKRWEEMKANARQPGANGKKAKDELDEALKGLGLRPRGTSTKAGKSSQDNATGIRDSRRSEPPAEYAEQYQQYNVGTSKGK
jgi:hypothetical protein